MRAYKPSAEGTECESPAR